MSRTEIPIADETRGTVLSWGTICILTLAAGVTVAVSFVRGPWLDEFWSLRMGDPALAIGTLVEDRWLADTNPVAANLLYRLAAATGATSIAALRIVLNLPALLFLAVATARMARRSPSASPFYGILAILVLSLPAAIVAASDYRSYFWQLCSSTVLLQYLYRRLAEPDAAPNLLIDSLGLVGLFVAVALHFVGGLIVSVLVAVALAALAMRARWAAFLPVAAAAGVVWISMLALAAVQYGRAAERLDHSWITTDTPMALQLMGAVLLGALLANPAAPALAALLGPGERAPDARRYAGVIATAIFASALLLLIANAIRPLVTDRYLLPWQPMLCAIIAALGARIIVAAGWRLYAVLACAVLSIVMTGVRQAREPGWYGTRDHIAAASRQCPSAAVYAVSAWRLDKARDTRAARLEDPVFADAYTVLARQGGFTVRIVPRGERVLEVPTACPLLLWVEHAGGRSYVDADALLRDAGLEFARPVRTTLFRSGAGFVVTATRLDRSAPEP